MISFANGTNIEIFKEPGESATDYERATAVANIVSTNGTNVWTYRNGTVAVIDNGVF